MKTVDRLVSENEHFRAELSREQEKSHGLTLKIDTLRDALAKLQEASNRAGRPWWRMVCEELRAAMVRAPAAGGVE